MSKEFRVVLSDEFCQLCEVFDMSVSDAVYEALSIYCRTFQLVSNRFEDAVNSDKYVLNL